MLSGRTGTSCSGVRGRTGQWGGQRSRGSLLLNLRGKRSMPIPDTLCAPPGPPHSPCGVHTRASSGPFIDEDGLPQIMYKECSTGSSGCCVPSALTLQAPGTCRTARLAAEPSPPWGPVKPAAFPITWKMGRSNTPTQGLGCPHEARPLSWF